MLEVRYSVNILFDQLLLGVQFGLELLVVSKHLFGLNLYVPPLNLLPKLLPEALLLDLL